MQLFCKTGPVHLYGNGIGAVLLDDSWGIETQSRLENFFQKWPEP